MFYDLLKLLTSPFIKFIWLSDLSGVENLDSSRRNYIVAANHSSYLDFILLFAVFPRKLTFLAAEKFFKNRVMGFFMLLLGQIKVDRSEKNKESTYKKVDSLFSKRGVLAIFPEGTRSRSGMMGGAFPGTIRFSKKYNVPIVPIGISGSFLAWPPGRKLPLFKKVIKIHIGQEYYPSDANENVDTKILMNKISKLIHEKGFSNI